MIARPPAAGVACLGINGLNQRQQLAPRNHLVHLVKKQLRLLLRPYLANSPAMPVSAEIPHSFMLIVYSRMTRVADLCRVPRAPVWAHFLRIPFQEVSETMRNVARLKMGTTHYQRPKE